MSRELLFSVGAKDCDWTYYRGSGDGGQHRNKKDTAARCIHRPSGAMGTAEDSKSQHQNKKRAFKRMVSTKKFRKWVHLEAARVTGRIEDIKKKVEKMMNSDNLRVEIIQDGKWRKADNELD